MDQFDGQMYRIEGLEPACYLEYFYDEERDELMGRGDLILNSYDGGSYIACEAYIPTGSSTLIAGNPVWLCPTLFSQNIHRLLGLPYHDERAAHPDISYRRSFPTWDRTRYLSMNGLLYDLETGGLLDPETVSRGR